MAVVLSVFGEFIQPFLERYRRFSKSHWPTGPRHSNIRPPPLRPYSGRVHHVGVLEGPVCENGNGTVWVGLA
jgi:hypothetical protein